MLLSSGFRSAAAILLLGWVGSSEVLATPSEPDAVGVRFVAEPAEGFPPHDPPSAATLTLVSRSGEARQELELSLPGEVVASLPRGSAWLASLHSKNSWSPAQDVELEGEGSERVRDAASTASASMMMAASFVAGLGPG